MILRELVLCKLMIMYESMGLINAPSHMDTHTGRQPDMRDFYFTKSINVLRTQALVG